MATTPRGPEEDENQFWESLEVLDIGVDAFNEGKLSAWMIISARLYIFFIDRSNGNIPLALRLISDLQLHPLYAQADSASANLVPSHPVVRVKNGIYSMDPLFNLQEPRIPLPQWLDQVPMIINFKPIDIRTIIKETRLQSGGGHFDENVRPLTKSIEQSVLITQQGRQAAGFHFFLAAIGAYIYDELMSQMERLAGVHWIDIDVERAKFFLERALERNHRLANWQGEAETLNSIGAMNINHGQNKEAVELLIKADALVAHINCPEVKVLIAHNLALAKQKLERS